MKKYIKIMRIDHWIKQLFILPGFFCCLYLGKYNINFNIIIKLILGLFATSLIASANYVINEFLDAEFDKYHPTKCKRTIVEKNVNKYIIYLLWFFLSLIGLLIGFTTLGKNFLLAQLWLLIMGILYNVKPFRTKDIVFLDVLSESINNSIRFLLGWFIVPVKIIIPISIILGYWMTGAFLMAIKRYAEYSLINNNIMKKTYYVALFSMQCVQYSL